MALFEALIISSVIQIPLVGHQFNKESKFKKTLKLVPHVPASLILSDEKDI